MLYVLHCLIVHYYSPFYQTTVMYMFHTVYKFTQFRNCTAKIEIAKWDVENKIEAVGKGGWEGGQGDSRDLYLGLGILHCSFWGLG